MDWIEKKINDPELFPPSPGNACARDFFSFHNFKSSKVYFFPDIPFPKAFMPNVKQIFRRLFRVFVHVYYHHFDKLIQIGAVWLPDILLERYMFFPLIANPVFLCLASDN